MLYPGDLRSGQFSWEVMSRRGECENYKCRSIEHLSKLYRPSRNKFPYYICRRIRKIDFLREYVLFFLKKRIRRIINPSNLPKSQLSFRTILFHNAVQSLKILPLQDYEEMFSLVRYHRKSLDTAVERRMTDNAVHLHASSASLPGRLIELRIANRPC